MAHNTRYVALLLAATPLLMAHNTRYVALLLAASLPPVAGVLDTLDDRGRHLADTVGHGDPAGGADIHLVLALVTDDVSIAAAGHWWRPWYGEADRADHRLLELRQEGLPLPPVAHDLPLPLPQARLETSHGQGLLPRQAGAGRAGALCHSYSAGVRSCSAGVGAHPGAL